MERHKTFISFYHFDDEIYKKYIVKTYSDYIINKSVENGEYDGENSDEYVKRLIREEKISDSSVVIVLVGQNTYKRKHVDWEIYAALRDSINGCSGLVGVLLPNFRKNIDKIPSRLADNIESKYAKVYDWDFFCNNFISIIQEAFDNRVRNKDLINNSRKQMQYNL